MEGTEGLHSSASRVAEMLSERGVQGPVRQFEESTKTAAEAAAALGCELGAIASCLVFVLDGEAVVILKSGAFRVDTAQFARLVGGTILRRANAEEVREATGQPIGAVSPAGWPARLRVFIDDSLADFEVIWSACGTPNAVFATTFEELRRLTGATVVTLARP